MARTGTPRERGEAPKRRRPTCAIGCLVLLVIVVVALIQAGRQVAQRAVVAELSRELPADSWTVRLGPGALVRALLQRPFALEASGRGVRPKDFPPLAEVEAQLGRVVYDRSTKKLAADVEATLLLAPEALAAWAGAQPVVSSMVSGLQAKLEGQNLVIEGNLLGGLSQLVPSFGGLHFVGTGTPEILPGGALGLELEKLDVDLPQALRSLGISSGADLAEPVKAELTKLLRLDPANVLPGLRLESVAIEGGGLRVQGKGHVE